MSVGKKTPMEAWDRRHEVWLDVVCNRRSELAQRAWKQTHEQQDAQTEGRLRAMKNALLVRMGGFVLRHEPLVRVPLFKRSIQVDPRKVLEEIAHGAYREE